MGPDTAEIHCYNTNNSFESEYVPQDKSISKLTESVDENYNMLVLISEEDYNDCISGDPDEEREWEPVINQATKTEYWRFKPAKSFIDENGERLSEEEHAKKYKMSLDVVTFVECCYSPKWSDGFDYYELWEACMSDGSIDGDEVDVDQLSQMIKDRKYWCGDNGGYVVMTDKYIADKEADDKSFEDYKKEYYPPSSLSVSEVSTPANVEPKERIRTGQLIDFSSVDSNSVKLTEDEWINFYENIYLAGEELFTNAVFLYVLNQEFTDDVLDQFKSIYADVSADELGIEKMPSPYEFIDYCRQAVIEYIQENEEYQLECPYFDFLSLYFALSNTELDTNLELLKFVQRHPEHPNLVKRYAEFMLCSTESGMEAENYISLQEPYWSVIKEHIVGNKNIPNPFYSGSGNTDEIYCNDWDDKIADLIENPEVIEVFTKAGFTVIPRKLETPDKLNERNRLTLEKRKEMWAQAEEDAQGPNCSSYLRTLLNKLKEAETPDVPAMIVLSKLIWFFQRSNWGSEEYQADAKAIGVEPYQPETFNDAFTEMMLSKYCTDDLADGEWQLNMSQQLLKDWEQKNPTIQIKGSHICITGTLTKTRKEYEDAIEAAGGINAKSVAKTTDILVCNLDHSSKKDKATELGIPIITEDQLIAALGDRFVT